MKTLRNLIVEGGLFQGEGTVEAVVGDSITLYLDTDHNDEFPASITGEIVGANSANCETAKSYDVEYDEADLTGASFLRPEDISDYLVLTPFAVLAITKADATALALTTILQGAEADQTRISSAHMPKNVVTDSTLGEGLTLTGLPFVDETIYHHPGATLTEFTFKLPLTTNSQAGQIKTFFSGNSLTFFNIDFNGNTVVGFEFYEALAYDTYSWQCVTPGTWLRLA